MNINDVLINANQIYQNNTGKVPEGTALDGVRINAADALLADLKAGDSLRAQVVSKDGNVVTLELPGNILFDAKVSSGINLDIGKLLTFEVKSSASGLTLSPLFTNMASDPNISKALNMAGLPVNESTVQMTGKMMEAGMSVDRNSLSAVFKDVSVFSEFPVEDIVDLHKLGIEVNENNLTQIDSYKNLSYQLGEGMNNVLNDLQNALSETALAGDTNGAATLLSQLSELASEISGVTVETEDSATSQNLINVNENTAAIVQSEVNAPTSADSEMSAAEKALKLLASVSDEGKTDTVSNETQKETLSIINSEKASDTVRIPLDENTRTALAEELKPFIGNIEDLSTKSFNELFALTKSIIDEASSNNDISKLSRLLNSHVIKDTVLSALSEQWNISPSDVADKEKVMELYQRLSRQLGSIREALENAEIKNNAAQNSVNNMSNNIDFLTQVNQMYSYIQLPIKLSGGENAHGDLYVYSNGRKLNMKDGKVSALLHLDMEHLGPVDVYVAMDTSTVNKKVSTQFYVADDSILDFLEEHMDELTERLASKGYSVSARTSLKGSKEAEENPLSSSADGGGINGILSRMGSVKLSEYSFDVRT